jgi:hypothetical protein
MSPMTFLLAERDDLIRPLSVCKQAGSLKVTTSAEELLIGSLLTIVTV